ncbi:MAG: ATP-grasp domain-containing protein [Chloroflexota bacterium]
MDLDDSQIALVFNQEEEIVRGESQDLIALQYTTKTASYIYDALCRLGYQTILVPVKNDLQTLARELGQYSPQNTFVFNICDGFAGDNFSAPLIPKLLNELGFKHTGSRAEAIRLCTDKARAKRHLVKRGVPTPAYQLFSKPTGDVSVQLPAIVKPVHEDASIGIEEKSVVTSAKDLFQRVDYVVSEYCQPALVEEYIVGREFAASMWGNGKMEVMPIVEHDFSAASDPLKSFLTYESKWVEDSFAYNEFKVVCPAEITLVEEESIKKVAVGAFRAMGLRDFGRVDMRYRDGVPYVIDINEIPDLSPDAGFARTSQTAGYSYDQMVDRILTLAMHREGWV